MAFESKGDGFKRTILITGSTDGIGKQTALELAAHQEDNFVIVHGRSKEKCEATIDYIITENKLKNRSNLDYIVADFSDLKQVKQMAEEVPKRFPNLNVLLCNAGVLEPRRMESRDGLELTFQVNYLAHFILVTRFLKLMEDNEPSRIITISSALHSWQKIDWDDIMGEKQYDKYLQYSRCKLMNHMMALSVHKIFAKRGCNIHVTSNVIELGDTQTVASPKQHCGAITADQKNLSKAVSSLVELIESAALTRVNHIVPYYLSRKFVPLLERNKPSRIIFVSSICYNWHPLDWNDMESKKRYEKYEQYSRTKLMVHMTAFRLAKLLGNSGVTCNVLEPGVIETKLLRNGGYSGAPLTEGSRCPVFLAESSSVATTNGAYFDNKCKKVMNLSADSTDVEQQERLWNFTEKLCLEFGCFF